MNFSHKWANQVLRARGFPSPGHDCWKFIIEKAEPDELSRMYAALQRIELGAEGVEEANWIVDLLRASKTLFESEKALVDEVRSLEANSTAPVAPRIVELPSPARKATSSEAKPMRPKHHIYGLKGALTVEMDELRSKSDDGSVLHTVIVEAASALAPRSYDWANKIAFQFMLRELPLLACALLGLLESPLELGNHGQGANKFFVITDQGERVFVQVKQGTRTIAVPVGPADVHAWIELVTRALASNAPAMGDAIQYASLRRIAAMENKRIGKTKASNTD